nr:ATP-dependent DNA helicase PIF1-like [Tanacetum cinerariifolium]
MPLKHVDNVKNKAVTCRLKASNNDLYILPQSGCGMSILLLADILALTLLYMTKRLYLYSTPSSLIIDDEKIPMLRRLKHDDSSGLELTKEVLPGDNTLPKPGTLENLIMWAKNRKYDIDKIRIKNGWNFLSRGGEKCKKGNVDRKGGQFWCDSCDSAVDYPVLRYRLEIKISDDTAEDEDETMGLPVALANIARTSQTLELKSHTYYEHQNFESFTGWRIVTDDVVEGGRDGNIKSFCGLNLSDIHTSHTGTSAAPAKGGTHVKRKEMADTTDHPFSQTAPRTTGTKVSYHSLGASSYQCYNCNATMWYEKRNNKGKRIANPTFSLCFQEGKVLLPRFIEPPEPLRRLLNYTEPTTSRFRDQIRVYNGMFCFTSFGARIDHSINMGRGLYTFHKNGQNYHRIGSLLPQEGTQPRTSSRQYNTPTVAEVVALITNDFGDWDPTRDIIVNTKNGQPKGILEFHTSYMALQYPLLFPYGEDGYDDKIPYHRNTGTRRLTENYQDAMALCQAYGNPDLFITFTSNPKWPKINEMLAHVPGQRTHDRPEVGTRVFKLKLTELLEDLTKNKIFGESRRTPEEIDDIISAELPSPTDDPTGYKAVTNYMLHGPCGKDARYLAPCEAVWRMLSFDIHYSYPSMMKLNFHLPNQQPVTLRDSDNLPALLEREGINIIMSTDWFALNEWHPPARARTYAEIPHYYVCYERLKMWKPQKQRKCIGDIGKTFLYKTIIARLRSERKIILVVASSGIESLLLPAERTAHNRFVILLELLENSTCGIKQNTYLAELMQEIELIIWDEAPMTQKYAFEALDKTLRDILGYPTPQTGTQSLNCGNIARFSHLHGELDTRKQDFNQWVLAVSDGKLPAKIKDGEDEPTWIQIPEKFLINASDSPIAQIVVETYPNFIEREKDDAYLKERAILTPRNDDADAINPYMFDKLESESITYYSADEICKASTDTLDQQHLYPVESLNTLNFPGMPPHALK